MNVLIVDDDQDLANLLKDLLEEQSYATELVHSGDKAMNLVSSNSFDAIICDVNMPMICGLEVMTEARSKGVERVIAISGVNAAEWESKARGATDFLRKPIDYDRLIRMLKD